MWQRSTFQTRSRHCKSQNLTAINNFIESHLNYLHCISSQQFKTVADGIHWSEGTARKILVREPAFGCGFRIKSEPRLGRGDGNKISRPSPDMSWSSASNILNLSKMFIPSLIQISLLERGLTFIPPPKKFSRVELWRDLYLYHRRLKLRDYFQDGDFCRESLALPSVWER